MRLVVNTYALALLQLFSPFQHFQAHRSYALLEKSQRFGGLGRKIDDDTSAPGFLSRAAVDDADPDRTAVFFIGDAQESPERP